MFVLCLQKILTLHVAGLLSSISFLILYKDFTDDQHVLGNLINFHCTHQRSIAMRKTSMAPNKEIAGWKNKQWKSRQSTKPRKQGNWKSRLGVKTGFLTYFKEKKVIAPKLQFRKAELGSSRIIKIDLEAGVSCHDSSKFWASCLKGFCKLGKSAEMYSSFPSGKWGLIGHVFNQVLRWHAVIMSPQWQTARLCTGSILYSSSAAPCCVDRALPALDSSGMGKCQLAQVQSSMHNFVGCILPLLWIWFFLANRLIFLTLS